MFYEPAKVANVKAKKEEKEKKKNANFLIFFFNDFI